MGEEPGFPRDGEFRALLEAAQEEFLASTHIPRKVKKDAAEFESDPESWLKAFQKSRHKTGHFDRACAKLGRHFKQIQTALSALGFAVDVIAAPFPALSPASLAVTAVSYLFVSLAKITEDFDRVEAYFKKLAKKVQLLSPLEGDIERLKRLAEPLKECIANLFKSWFALCSIGITQTKHRHLKFWKKLFDEDEFDEALSKTTEAETDLKESMEDLNLILNTKTYLEVSKIVDKYEDDERDDILDWLSKLSFGKEHQSLQERVGESLVAGRWLLESDTFTRWRDGDSHRLWYTGNPGAGKSVLASIVTEYLQEWVQRPENARKGAMVACLYLSYKENPELTELLGSVLRQFQSNSTEIDSEVRHLFKENRQHGEPLRPLGLKNIKWLLSKLAKRQMYIIVDAMDECERDVRYPLVECLEAIGQRVKILVTSRVLGQQEDLQHGFVEQKIEAHDDDMQDYIDQVIRSHGILHGFSEQIKEQVPQRSGKMFLIAQLHMKALTEAEVPNDVIRILQSLPDTISGGYEDTMNRIMESKQPKRRERAKAILGWVSFARRPLSVRELQHAIASEEVTTKIERGDLIPESDIASYGHGLIVIDADKLVHFLHYSTQEYFNERRIRLFPDFENRIVLSCAKYLCRTELQQRFFPDDCPFERYAAQNLHFHCHRVRNDCRDPRVAKAISTMIQRRPSRTIYNDNLRLDDYFILTTAFDPEKMKVRSKPIPILHLAVFLGLVEPVQEVIKKASDINERDWLKQSAVALALKHRFDDIACILLDSGATVNLSLKKGYMVLRYAVEKGCTDAAKKLVRCFPDHEADPLLKRYRELIPLAYDGDVKGLVALLDPLSTQTIDLRPVKRTNSRRKESVSGISEFSHGQSDLLDESDFPPGDESGDDLDDDSSDESSGGVGDDSRNEFGGDGNKKDSSKEENSNRQSNERPNRLAHKMSINPESMRTVTLKMACFLAVDQGHFKVVKLFLDHGVNPNLKILNGQSLLHRATAKSNYDIAELLLNYSAKANTRDWAGRTPLMANAQVANDEVLDLLKQRGAKMNLFQGGTMKFFDHEQPEAVFVAAVSGAVDVVRFFLDNGADASCMSSIGWTPLHAAASQGHVECARLLLERGANASLVTGQGKTPLDLAVSGPRYRFNWRIPGELDNNVNGYSTGKLSVEDMKGQRKMTVELLKGYGAKLSQDLTEKMDQLQCRPWHDDYWAEYERREEVTGVKCSRLLRPSAAGMMKVYRGAIYW